MRKKALFDLVSITNKNTKHLQDFQFEPFWRYDDKQFKNKNKSEWLFPFGFWLENGMSVRHTIVPICDCFFWKFALVHSSNHKLASCLLFNNQNYMIKINIHITCIQKTNLTQPQTKYN